MKVLAITHIFPSRDQPQAGIFNAQQLAEVSKKVDLTLLTPVPWPRAVRNCGRHVESVEPAAPFERHSPLYVYPPGLFRGWHGRFYLASIRRAAEKLRRSRPFDLVYGMFAFPDGWAAARLAEEWELPFVLMVQGSDVHHLRKDPARSGRVIEAIRSARKVIAVSGALGQEVEEIAPGAPVVVVRNGVDLGRFSPGSRSEARSRLGVNPNMPLVLFVGRLEEIKGADLLPRIAAGLGNKVAWAIVGGGGLSTRLRRDMGEYDVRWIPKVPHADLVHWYRACDVFVLPSRNEGLPNAFLEALACDRPVVAASVGGVPEVLTDPRAGTLVEPGDPAPFSREIAGRLARAPEEGVGRALVEKTGWAESAAGVVRVLEGVAAC